MLTLTIGDSFQHTATITDDSNALYDLAECTLWFTIKRALEDSDTQALARLHWVEGGTSEGITVDDVDAGQAAVELTPEQTASFESGTYRYDLQIQNYDGTIHTADRGIVVARPGVTMRTTTP